MTNLDVKMKSTFDGHFIPAASRRQDQRQRQRQTAEGLAPDHEAQLGTLDDQRQVDGKRSEAFAKQMADAPWPADWRLAMSGRRKCGSNVHRPRRV